MSEKAIDLEPVIELSLVDNAVDSLIHGIDHWIEFEKAERPSDAKWTIQSLIQAFDLFVLERLRRLDPKKIFTNPTADEREFGYRQTIHVEKAFDQIKNQLNTPLTGTETKAYMTMKIGRNAAEHYKLKIPPEYCRELFRVICHMTLRFGVEELGFDFYDHIESDRAQFIQWQIADIDFTETVHVLLDSYKRASKAQSLWRECIVEGGPQPLADWSCEECDRTGVSILSRLYDVGKCIYCDHQHEVEECERCGYIFNVNQEGYDMIDFYLCGSCYDYYDKQ